MLHQPVVVRDHGRGYSWSCSSHGLKKIAIILPKNRDTAILNRLYIRIYIKFYAYNGKNRDSAHAAISFCPWLQSILGKLKSPSILIIDVIMLVEVALNVFQQVEK